jgi:O-antigen/teichoic acid export membrane protein
MTDVADFFSERLKRLLGKGSYGRDTFVNTVGLLVVAIVPIAALPILSRLYSPEDFGLFGVFTAVVGLGTIASTGRYEAAVMLPEEDRSAIAVAAAAFAFVFAFMSVLAIAVAIAWFGGISLVRDHLSLACLAVVAIGFSGAVQILLNAAIRHRMFVKVNFARIVGAIATAFLSIFIGVYHVDSIGLAIGLTAGYVVCSVVLLQFVVRHYRGVALPDGREIRVQARRYRHFPLFSLPSDFSDTLAVNLPVLFFSTFYGAAATGYLTMFQRVWAGTSVVVKGLGETFRHRAALEKQQTGAFGRTVKMTLVPLFAVAVVLAGFLVFLGPTLFAIVIGAQWREAGVYGQILAPLVCLQFIASPISWSFYISERLKLLAMWQLALLMGFLVTLLVGTSTLGSTATLTALSATGSVLYVMYIFISVRISRHVQ